MSGKDKTGHSYEGDDADRDYCYASVNTPGTPLTQPCGQTRAAHVPDKTVRADKTVGGRTKEEWVRFAETYYGYVLPTAQLKELISEAFDSRGIREGLERAAKWQPIETAPKDGTWVLVYSASWKDAPPEVAQYDESFGWYMPGHEEPNEVLTHWLPLPAAPALRAEASKLDGEEQGRALTEPERAFVHGVLCAKRPCQSCAPEPPAEERKLPLGHVFDACRDASHSSLLYQAHCREHCGRPGSAHEPTR
jgi:hypothetical protein